MNLGSLAVGGVAARPYVSAGTLAITRSKAGDKVLCSYCGKMFGEQGIKNHIAKCAEKNGFQGWGRLEHEPVSDLDGGFDNLDDDDDELDNTRQRHDSRKVTFQNRAQGASPPLRHSATAGDAANSSRTTACCGTKEG